MAKKRNNRTIIWILVAVIVLLVAVLAAGYQYHQLNERQKVMSSFTCGCCESTLLSSDSICALGYKEKIKQMQSDGARGRELYVEAVKLLGAQNIIDEDLRQETRKSLINNPPISRPILSMSSDYVDFGEVSESRTGFVMKEFRIKNTGLDILYITNVRTSCSCLSTKLVTDEKESPSFGRFSHTYGMVVPVPPGEDIRLRVTYDARVNSFFRGHETRFVYVDSTDPITPVKQITVDVEHVD